LRKDATVGITIDELQRALAVITQIKENLLALEKSEASAAADS